jgi:hypothetical protein
VGGTQEWTGLDGCGGTRPRGYFSWPPSGRHPVEALPT